MNDKGEVKVLRISDLMRILGIGREKAAKIMRLSGFPSKKIGATYYVLETSFYMWLKTMVGKTVYI